MKFAATVLAFASVSAAMPWFGSSKEASSEDLTLHIEVSQHQGQSPVETNDICWLLCASNEIKCPNGWYASQQGDCWTCCRGTNGLEASPKVVEKPKKQDVFTSGEDICWAICAEESLKCPGRWKNKAFGECNTCCLNSDDVETTARTVEQPQKQQKVTASGDNAVCYLACWFDKPTCNKDAGWYAKKQGECWTCCKDISSNDVPVVEAQKPKKNEVAKQKVEDVSAYDVCLRVCWPSTPTCPKGWYSNNLGSANQPCWTCCKAPEDFLQLQL